MIERICKQSVYLTQILFGILSPIIQYKEWKFSKLWNHCAKYEFVEINQIVEYRISQFMFNNNIKYKLKV